MNNNAKLINLIDACPNIFFSIVKDTNRAVLEMTNPLQTTVP